VRRLRGQARRLQYASAFAGYVAGIGDDENVLAVLAAQLDEVLARLGSIPDSRGDYRYAPGKWSLKEVIGHLSDTERVWAYRALRVARGDPTPCPVSMIRPGSPSWGPPASCWPT